MGACQEAEEETEMTKKKIHCDNNCRNVSQRISLFYLAYMYDLPLIITVEPTKYCHPFANDDTELPPTVSLPLTISMVRDDNIQDLQKISPQLEAEIQPYKSSVDGSYQPTITTAVYLMGDRLSPEDCLHHLGLHVSCSLHWT